jgi:hypothetical protein
MTKKKMVDADEVEAEMEQLDETEVLLSAKVTLKVVITLVAHKQGKVGEVLDDWVKAMVRKIQDVGITTLRRGAHSECTTMITTIPIHCCADHWNTFASVFVSPIL